MAAYGGGWQTGGRSGVWLRGVMRRRGESQWGKGGTARDGGVGRIRAWRNWPLLQLDVAAIRLG